MTFENSSIKRENRHLKARVTRLTDELMAKGGRVDGIDSQEKIDKYMADSEFYREECLRLRRDNEELYEMVG